MKHKWVSARNDEHGESVSFDQFSAALAFMNKEFTVKGWEGMTLVDKRGDTSSVYSYADVRTRQYRSPLFTQHSLTIPR